MFNVLFTGYCNSKSKTVISTEESSIGGFLNCCNGDKNILKKEADLAKRNNVVPLAPPKLQDP